MAEIKVVNEFGTLGTVPEDQADLALQQGYRLATEDEIKRADLQAQYGSGVDQLLATGSGVLSGVTFGGTDAVLAALGADDALRAYEALYPELRAGGKIAGAILPAFVSGGGSTAASLAKTAATAGEASLAGRAAMGAAEIAAAGKTALGAARAAENVSLGKAALGGLGKVVTALPRATEAAGVATRGALGLAERPVLGTAVELAAQGIYEGAAQGIGEGVANALINNEKVGEKIGEILTDGALSGAAGGLIGSVLGVGVGKWQQRATRLASEVPEGVTESFWQKVQRKTYAKQLLKRGATEEEAERWGRHLANQEAQINALNDLNKAITGGKEAPVTIKFNVDEVPSTTATEALNDLEARAAKSQAETEAEMLAYAQRLANEVSQDAAPELAALRQRVTIARTQDAAPDLPEQQSLRDIINDLVYDAPIVREVVGNEKTKAKVLLKDIPANNYGAQRAFAGAWLEDQKSIYLDMALKGATYFDQNPVTKMLDVLTRLEDNVKATDLIKSPKQRSVKLFGAMEEAKRDIGRIRKKMKPGTTTANDTADAIGKSYDGVRVGLESEPLWGRPGVFQRDRNATIHQAILRESAFMNDIMESGARRANPVDPWAGGLPLASDNKLRSVFLEMGASPGGAKETTFLEYLNLQKQYYDQLATTGDWRQNKELFAVVKRQKARIDKALELFETARESARRQAVIKGIPEGIIIDAAATAPGPIGRTMREVVGALTNVEATGSVFRVINAITKSHADQTAAAVARATSNLEKRASKISAEVNVGRTTPPPGLEGTIAPPVSMPTQAEVPTAAAPAMVPAAKPARTGSSPLTRRLPVAGSLAYNYFRAANRVRELAENQEQVRARLERETSNIAAAPGTRSAAINTSMRSLQYVIDTMPKDVVPGTPFSARIPPSKQEMTKWLNRVEAIKKPLSILDQLKDGTVRPESVEAVAAVYPEMFADMQAQLMDRLSAMDAAGRKPERKDLINLGLMFNIPTAPELTPDLIRVAQSIYAQQSPEERQGMAPSRGAGKAPDFAANYESGAQETAQA